MIETTLLKKYTDATTLPMQNREQLQQPAPPVWASLSRNRRTRHGSADHVLSTLNVSSLANPGQNTATISLQPHRCPLTEASKRFHRM